MSARESKITDKQVIEYAEYLSYLGKDRKKNARQLAELRRSLQDSHGMATAACPHVLRFLPAEENLNRTKAFFLVGALFASHPEQGANNLSLGGALRLFVHRDRAGGVEQNESVRRRFVALLDSPREDLGEHLRHLLDLLGPVQSSICWAQLLYDVLRWDDESRHVQRRLARDFWATDLTSDNEGETKQ
ncbi:MAG: type I-E CRISPR-associated protein Cse2/CasB [Polyangiaceae bacterium]|nr:type I-E CRISPR-associated protein Cse2/CasB [Polyangiaceae bacterium]